MIFGRMDSRLPPQGVGSAAAERAETHS